MPRLVLGVTGPIGSGVTTTADTLAKHGFRKLKISDQIKAEMPESATDMASDPNLRKTLQDIGNERRRTNPAYWVERSLRTNGICDENQRILDSDTDLVIDSLRNPLEVTKLRDLFAPNFFLIAIQASRDARWKRVKKDYVGQELSFDRDDSRDTDEDITHGQQVDACVQLADYVLVNEDDKGSIDAQQQGIWERLKSDMELMRTANQFDRRESMRSASPEEVAMAVAYAQSHQSACLKRHVGAVIVAQNGLTLSTGFNENPVPMKSCKVKHGHCFKDDEMHRSLEGLSDIFCPRCGSSISKITPPYVCNSCDENLKSRLFPSRNMELCTAIHAEERAIRSLGDRSAEGATLYCTTFPCFQCARYIVDAGIKTVIYVEAYPVAQSLKFLGDNNVTIRPFGGFKARAFNLVFKQIR